MRVSRIPRPTAAMGAVLVGASAILAAPGIGAGASAVGNAIAAEVSLTSLGWQDIWWEAVPQNNGNDSINFDSAAEAQLYADEMAATFLSYGQIAVQVAGWIDPFLSLAGISGFGAWVSSRYDMLAEILEPGWNPSTWYAELVDSLASDPNVLFGPVLDFDLGWLYGLLGISASDGEQVDTLLELLSGMSSWVATQDLVTGFLATPGLINALADGLINFEFPAFQPDGDTIGYWIFDLSQADLTSAAEWILSRQDTISDSFENVTAIFEDAPGLQWIWDFLGPLLDGGVDVPF